MCEGRLFTFPILGIDLEWVRDRQTHDERGREGSGDIERDIARMPLKSDDAKKKLNSLRR